MEDQKILNIAVTLGYVTVRFRVICSHALVQFRVYGGYATVRFCVLCSYALVRVPAGFVTCQLLYAFSGDVLNVQFMLSLRLVCTQFVLSICSVYAVFMFCAVLRQPGARWCLAGSGGGLSAGSSRIWLNR
jgi:hypothetical protein